MPTSTTRTLLKGLIDYAGLFPPAKLDMDGAVAEYARQRQSENAWMLGRFVVPIDRLDELATAVGTLSDAGEPWPLSVLANGDPHEESRRVNAFQQRHGRTRATVEAIETRLEDRADVAPAMAAFAGLEVYFEIPHRGDPTADMAEIARHGGRAKIRSGGVTAEAFPTAMELARFLRAAARTGVAFKATAGLHHPLRGEYRLTYDAGSPEATMHGFLNVFLAAALARSDDPGSEEIETLLEERDPRAFALGPEEIRWRDRAVPLAALADARENFATSYGSCSFQEPIDELETLELL